MIDSKYICKDTKSFFKGFGVFNASLYFKPLLWFVFSRTMIFLAVNHNIGLLLFFQFDNGFFQSRIFVVSWDLETRIEILIQSKQICLFICYKIKKQWDTF
jgi:hypothetical protein